MVLPYINMNPTLKNGNKQKRILICRMVSRVSCGWCTWARRDNITYGTFTISLTLKTVSSWNLEASHGWMTLQLQWGLVHFSRSLASKEGWSSSKHLVMLIWYIYKWWNDHRHSISYHLHPVTFLFCGENVEVLLPLQQSSIWQGTVSYKLLLYIGSQNVLVLKVGASTLWTISP